MNAIEEVTTVVNTRGFRIGQRITIDAPDAPELHGMECTITGFADWGAHTVVNRAPRPYDRKGHVPKYRAGWEEMIPREQVQQQPARDTAKTVIQKGADKGTTPKPNNQHTMKAVASGNACGKCGGLMVRTGKCETCQQCGDSPGGCS